MFGRKEEGTLEKRKNVKKSIISERMLLVMGRKGKSRNCCGERIIYILKSEVSPPFSLQWI